MCVSEPMFLRLCCMISSVKRKTDPGVGVGRAVFYSCTFLGPFGGPRNSIFELSFETQSLEIALVE